ncbi:MAG TPA: aspartyl-phosphate phosphatase Spo0E family protein [Syntrophomonadaceae bacterium]|nr:aspartyl-phosphate phosphatase Spo0E family protein [Syntrophomonadaceae bacterium]
MDVVERIEELRIILNKLGEAKGLQDPEVIRISQILDEMINTYYGNIEYDELAG